MQAMRAVGVRECHRAVAAPAFAEVAAQAGGLDRETPLVIVGRPAHDRGFGNQSAADLANDALQRHAGEGADVLEDEPRASMLAHLLDHVLGEILTAVLAGGIIAMHELAAGDARDGLPVPGFVGERAERTKTCASGDFEGVTAGRQGVVEFGNLRVVLCCLG